MREDSGMMHSGMTGKVHLCLGNLDWTGPRVICQPPSGPRGATDWLTAGGETSLFIGTRAWLIKQVPLGQKAAGVALLHVPVSAKVAGRHTPPHKGGKDDTALQSRKELPWGCNCLGVFRCQDCESEKRSGMCLLWLIPIYFERESTAHTPILNSFMRKHRVNKSNLFKDLKICILGAPTNTPTCTHAYWNAATNKLRRWKSCQKWRLGILVRPHSLKCCGQTWGNFVRREICLSMGWWGRKAVKRDTANAKSLSCKLGEGRKHEWGRLGTKQHIS